MKFYTVENNKKSIMKTFAIYYICMVCFCLVRILAGLNVFPDGNWGDVLFTIIIQFGILFALPLFLYCTLLKVKPKEVFKTCNYNKINFAVVCISIGIGVLCFFINIAVSSLFNGILTFTGYRFGSTVVSSDYYSVGNFFLQLFLVAVCPALCEEFLHRGIVLQGTKHWGFAKSIVISSVLFGLLHLNIQQVAYAIVIGLILGFVSVVAKSIWPAVIIHFMNNAISTYLDFASARSWLFGDALEKLQSLLVSGNSVLIFFISLIVMIAVVALLCLLVFLLYKQTIIRKVNKAINKAYMSESVYENRPIKLKDNEEVIKDLLESSTLLNLDYKKMDNPISLVMPKEKSRYKSKPIDKTFMWGAIFLGFLITLFTYIWGLF